MIGGCKQPRCVNSNGNKKKKKSKCERKSDLPLVLYVFDDTVRCECYLMCVCYRLCVFCVRLSWWFLSSGPISPAIH